MAPTTRNATAVLSNPTSRRILACLLRCTPSAAERHAARRAAVDVCRAKSECR